MSDMIDPPRKRHGGGCGCLVIIIVIIVIGAFAANQYAEDVPYRKASGGAIDLDNNKQAKNPTWQQLKTFLANDTTDEHSYYDPFYTCGDFAEQLHNNAEAHGIRCAVVAVEFQSIEPHALNAFNTTDKGLVYIDVTGKGLFDDLVNSSPSLSSILFPDETPMEGPPTHDKVAYLQVGRRLGFVSPESTGGDFTYQAYERGLERLSELTARLDRYNADVEEFNTFLKKHDRCPSISFDHRACLNSQDSQTAEAWEARLRSEEAQIDEQWETLRGYLWEPVGVVSGVEIYW
ncbi:MAG: hypothetical protein PHV74_11665 [Dehalococcoidia bacterium]|nr:hypothetical protein [Dehalococcoidia bacterium]